MRGSDMLYQGASGLARCVVSTASVPPLPPSTPTPLPPARAEVHAQPLAGGTPLPACSMGGEQAGQHGPGMQTASERSLAAAAWTEALGVCQGLARSALLDALLHGGARAADRCGEDGADAA